MFYALLISRSSSKSTDFLILRAGFGGWSDLGNLKRSKTKHAAFQHH